MIMITRNDSICALILFSLDVFFFRCAMRSLCSNFSIFSSIVIFCLKAPICLPNCTVKCTLKDGESQSIPEESCCSCRKVNMRDVDVRFVTVMLASFERESNITLPKSIDSLAFNENVSRSLTSAFTVIGIVSEGLSIFCSIMVSENVPLILGSTHTSMT